MPMPKKPRTECLNCGKQTKRAVEKYCSNKCQHEFEYKLYIESWLAGQKSGVSIKYGNISKRVRRFLIEKYGEKCSLCGWCQVNPYTGKIPVEVDHIDGDWQNNSPDNLRLLCPNCHSLTPTYKARNKGKGRNWRRETPAISRLPRENSI
ncbi:MAG: HNH endonuclease signature motif containing protein [Phormidium sp.]